MQPAVKQISPSLKACTGELNNPNAEQTGTGAIMLTGPMKVVQVPVAGQPGQFITGLLPVPPTEQGPPQPDSRSKMLQKIAMVVALIVLLVGGTTGILYMRSH